MLSSFRNYISQDDSATTVLGSDAQPGTFRSIRNRASKTLPNFNLALPSIAGIRERTFGISSSSISHKEGPVSDNVVDPVSRHSRSTLVDNAQLDRRRSHSSPAEPQPSLRRRAIQMRDSAILDIKTRANAIDFSRLPSFHFSLPFSDSTTPSPLAPEMDNMSMTSLEVEALVTDTKAENNRLRGLIEGLPRLGIPRFSPEEPYAGLSEVTKDLNIIVLGGYRGSILRSAEDDRMLWVPVKLGLGIRKVDLELPLHEKAELEASRTIRPDGMLTHIGPLDISRRLLKKLRDMQDRGFCKVHEFGYDWRLGGTFIADQLLAFMERLEGKILVIAHSLGGLATLHALNRRPELFRGVLFAGTPFHGCPNILGPFRYGDGVLLNKSVLNAQTNFSMRSSFILLPTHKRCFVDIESGKELPIDFFDPEAWAEYGLSPMVANDFGAGDVGEATETNAFMATGGIGGPAMNDGTTEDEEHPNKSATNKMPFTRNRVKAGPEDREYRDAARQYLARTLRATLEFKDGLHYNSNIKYPPISLLRASSTATVRGCNVHGYGGIKDGDYSKFIFSPGDGVVTYASSDLATLHRQDMHADWQSCIVKDVENDRGHIGLLGDLNGVAQCIEAILSS